jgi:hypothetical protein
MRAQDDHGEDLTADFRDEIGLNSPLFWANIAEPPQPVKIRIAAVLCALAALLFIRNAPAQWPFPDASASPGADSDTASLDATGAAATAGFHVIPDHYTVQHPYDLQASDRFSAVGGIFTCWVFGHDKPLKEGSGTGPRTEMRWETWPQQDHENQMEFDVKFDEGTTKTCIFQVKSNSGGREAIYLQVHGPGELRDGVGPVFATGMAGKWFHVNASYNPATGHKRLWIDGVLKLESTKPSTVHDWYFKNGTYSNGIAPGDRSYAQFKNFKHWVQ